MLARKLLVKRLNPFSSFLSLSSAKRFCDDSKKTDPPKEEKATQENLGRAAIAQLLDDSVQHSGNFENEWATSPYPQETIPDHLKKPVRPKTDPRETSVLMFPGQGIIKVGQVKEYLPFPGARELFTTANEILGYDLLKICLEGPQKKLNQTNFNQPATVVTCLAALEKLREDRPSAFQNCKVAVGYSVGEITSLIAASAISYEDGLQLINARSTAMHYASTKAPQGMLLAHLTVKTDTKNAIENAKKWAMNLGVSEPVCGVAAYLSTEVKVIGGHKEALDYLQTNSAKYNFGKLTKIPVSGAFHTLLMKPALNAVNNALDKINFESPRCTVYSNWSGHPVTEKQIRKLILNQIIRPVKWEQCVQRIYSRPEGEAFPKTYDIASNGSMKAILQRINSKAANTTIVI